MVYGQNAPSCDHLRHRFVNPHLNDNIFQLHQPIVFILSDWKVLTRSFVLIAQKLQFLAI